ncbi:methyltransferase [Methanocalculus chunghsingensis]|uniref:Methyltransferase-like protein 5 n=1 Tax=Methanocalculus chunghsingensis TaxID=156457 RepID=A0A8J7W8J5_9EURY|nr:METTL5 family protein [Methanocalculus chunghsingensis]MBR1369458.1 methyltransferase [Methanocalculus chunghsingensis]
MKLRTLEMKMQQVAGIPDPDPTKEQYQTPATVAARLLFDAYLAGDIDGASVCDLGSGTGILAIGAALLGAEQVTGYETEQRLIEVAEKNAASLSVDCTFIEADITEVSGSFDTVLMNPPFGAQKVHADRPFIDTALRIAPVVYGIFNAGTLRFLTPYIEGRAEISGVVSASFPIPRMFSFHRRDLLEIPVEIVCMRRI